MGARSACTTEVRRKHTKNETPWLRGKKARRRSNGVSGGRQRRSRLQPCLLLHTISRSPSLAPSSLQAVGSLRLAPPTTLRKPLKLRGFALITLSGIIHANDLAVADRFAGDVATMVTAAERGDAQAQLYVLRRSYVHSCQDEITKWSRAAIV
jgi:hypothetical protein